MDDITNLHFQLRDMYQQARAHADQGDDRVRGETVARIAKVESTCEKLLQQLSDLRTVLSGEPVAPARRFPEMPGFFRDWRFWLAIILAVAAARSPEMIPFMMKFGL